MTIRMTMIMSLQMINIVISKQFLDMFYWRKPNQCRTKSKRFIASVAIFSKNRTDAHLCKIKPK